MLRRLTSAAALLALTALAACDAPQAVGAPTGSRISAWVGGGNSSAAHLCYHGGWQNLATADGTAFTSVGDCVSYGAHGGTPAPFNPPTITSLGFTTQCPPGGVSSPDIVFTAVFGGGGGTITTPTNTVFPITSGVATDVGTELPGTYTLTVTNGSVSVTATSPIGSIDGGCGSPGVIFVAPRSRGGKS